MNIFLVLCALLSVGSCSIMRQQFPGNICEYHGHKLSIGESIKPSGECVEMSCGKEEGNTVAVFAWCPPAPVTDEPGFRKVEHKDRPYPECCPTLEKSTKH